MADQQTGINPITEAEPDGAGLTFAGLSLIWIVGVSALTHLVAWSTDQFMLATGNEWPRWLWPFISFAHALVLIVPLAILVFLVHGRRYQGILQGWLVASLYIFLLAFTRFAGRTATQTANLLQILLTLFFIAGLLAWLRFKNPKSQIPNPNLDSPNPKSEIQNPKSPNPLIPVTLIALSLAAVLAYPWLAWGALGSPLDTALNLLAALLFGTAAALIVNRLMLPAIRQASYGPAWDITLGGFAIGGLLLIMATGFAFPGLQILLALSLPAIGWLAAAIGLARAGRSPLALTLLIGLTAAAPLLLIDPDEMSLLLMGPPADILNWVFRAAFLALFLGWLLGALFTPLTNRLLAWPRPLLAAGLLLAWLGGALIYFLIGQPGFYGEQLFVIFKDQADLSAAATLDDYDGRRQFVYNTLVAQANQSQADIRANLDRLGVDYTPYYLVNALDVEGGPILRLWLASRPEVDRVLDNPILRPLPHAPAAASGDITTPPAEPRWNLTSIGADRVWQELGVTGAGIIVGQSDSGVQGDHPEFAANYRGRDGNHDYNWYDPWNHTAVPTDIGGHGTHTLGSILGQNVGVAPGAEWYGCTNLARNLANPAYYLDCMQFMLAPFPIGGDPLADGDPTRSAHVLNNSWGCPPLEGCDANALLPAVRALRAAGIFVVASAGNDGPDCESVNDPLALYDDVFSVGAVNVNGELADFSSRGPVTVDGSNRIKPDLLAPGASYTNPETFTPIDEGILSAFPGSSYEYAEGTSMAGPHIVGVIALVWSANPDLIGDIDQTEQILIDTARPYAGAFLECGSGVPNNGTGYGIVDAYAAVQRALEVRN
jgi:subtilisin family serine protease